MGNQTRGQQRILGVLLASALAASLAVVNLACGTDDGGSTDVVADSPNVGGVDAPEVRQHEVGYVFVEVGAWDDTNLEWPSAQYPAITNMADELAIMGVSPANQVALVPGSSIEGFASAELLRDLGRADDSASPARYPVIANFDDELAIMGLSPSGLAHAVPASSIEGYASAELLWELGRPGDSISTAGYPVFANIDDELAIMGRSAADLVFAVTASPIEGYASAELLWELGRNN